MGRGRRHPLALTLLLLAVSSAPPTPASSLIFASGPIMSSGGGVVGISPPDSSPSTSSDSLPLLRLAEHANAYASARGIQVETRNDDESGDGKVGVSAYRCAPISLLPNAYPRSAFESAISLSGPFNSLVDRVSRDSNFIERALGGEGGAAEADPFTGRILRLYREVYLGRCDGGDGWGKFGRGADRLGVHRSDYMLHRSDTPGGGGGGAYALKQVELNTIAASFAGLAVQVSGLHRHLTERYGYEVGGFLAANARSVAGDGPDDDGGGVGVGGGGGVPPNPALDRIPSAISAAHGRYVGRFCPGSATAVGGGRAGGGTAVLFVVQDGETNTVDQRMLEFALWDDHSVPVVRMSLTSAHAHLELDERNGALRIKEGEHSPRGPTEISVVYYRAGYAPTDYPGGDDGPEWTARTLIERSRSTKCPCAGYHLAGTKKCQQELSRPGELERFFPLEEEAPLVDAMRGAFAGLYGLGDNATERDMDAVADALSPGGEGRYVLKPQREGGGYNYYGGRMASKLRDNTSSSPDGKLRLGPALAEFILMERLFPPRQDAVLLRGGRVEGTGRTVSELGCFGTCVMGPGGEEAAEAENGYAGWILRTKFEGVDEGGVASGFATLSSPYLC